MRKLRYPKQLRSRIDIQKSELEYLLSVITSKISMTIFE